MLQFNIKFLSTFFWLFRYIIAVFVGFWIV